MGFKWTDAELQILRTEIATNRHGFDVAAVALRINRSEGAIISRAWKERREASDPGIPRRLNSGQRRLRDVQFAEAKRLYRLGMIATDACVKAGLGQSAMVKKVPGSDAVSLLTAEDRRLHDEAVNKPRCVDCGTDASDYGIIEPTDKVRKGRRLWVCGKCRAVYRFPLTAPVSDSRIGVFGPSG